MRTRYIVLVLFLALALPAYSQTGPQARSKAEADAYTALYDETDNQAKVELGEAFLRDFPDSEFSSAAFQILIRTHAAQNDWAGVLDTASRFNAMVPDAEPDAKDFVYRYALAAAQTRNAVPQILEFGRLLLEVSPNNLGAMLTLGTVYMENLPTSEPARGRALSEAYDLASRARVQAQQLYASDSSRAAERTQVEITIHTILARVHYARTDYQRAADEYLQVVTLAPNDGDAYYRLGDCYQFLAVAASHEVEATLADRTQALEQGRDQATIDQLQARYDALQANVLAYLDRSIDFFLTATSIGGQIGPSARQRLESLYRNRNDDSLDGLEELIEERRASLRSR